MDSYTLINERDSQDCSEKAFFLLTSGKLDESIALISECIKEKGPDSLLYYNRGVAYRHKGWYREALADFERAINLKPEMFKAYKNIDWILAREGQWERIASLWTRYIAACPQDPEGYFERAGAYHHGQKKQESLKDLQKACDMGKKEACAWLKKLNHR